LTPLIFLFAFSSIFDMLSGMRDASNFVSTIISTRALPARVALGVAAVAEFCGPFIFGVAVAYTFGRDLIDPQTVTISALMAAILSAIVWNMITLYMGFPASSSHALLGGLIGALLVSTGPSSLRLAGMYKIMLALFLSPMLGLLVGFLLTKLIYFLSRSLSPRVNDFFRRIQIVTSITLAMAYGANDAQKTMGVLSLALVTTGYLNEFHVPIWIVAFSAGSIALGIAVGGWRLIRTLGGRFYRIRPVHGFSSQASAATVILTSAVLGGPVSSSQVVTSAILGAGSADRINQVRWELATHILTAWLLTIPICGLIAAGLEMLIRMIL
jgi:PiT family inorganic phosphate transporter